MTKIINNKTKFIGQIQKNKSELIKAHVLEWKGNYFLDLRVFYRSKNESGEFASTKGFRFNAALLDDLITLLNSAKKKLESSESRNEYH